MPNLFNLWNIIKQSLNRSNKKTYIRQGEIRRVFFGQNIQSEI
jgi:hypothetical protein